MIWILLRFISYMSSTREDHICELCDIYDLTNEKKFEETIERRIGDSYKDIQHHFTENNDYIYVMALKDRIIINNKGQYEEIKFSIFSEEKLSKFSDIRGNVDL